jgi:hypothetical protein
MFYIDVGLIASEDPGWLQELFDILIGLLEWICLLRNVSKTKDMVCILGQIQETYTEEQYAKYKSLTKTAADNKRHRINCVRFVVPALQLDLTKVIWSHKIFHV